MYLLNRCVVLCLAIWMLFDGEVRAMWHMGDKDLVDQMMRFLLLLMYWPNIV